MITSVSEFKARYTDIISEIPDPEITIINPTTEPIIPINNDLRTITIPNKLKKPAVITDTNAETLYFSVDRFFDSQDLFETKCCIQYVNANSVEYTYPVTTFYIDENDESKLIIGWTISSNVTEKDGEVKFAIRWFKVEEVETVDEETEEVVTEQMINYCLNTVPSIITVMNGLDITGSEESNRLATDLEIAMDKMGNKIKVIDNFVSSSVTDAASANCVRLLNDRLTLAEKTLDGVDDLLDEILGT